LLVGLLLMVIDGVAWICLKDVGAVGGNDSRATRDGISMIHFLGTNEDGYEREERFVHRVLSSGETKDVLLLKTKGVR